SPCRQTVIFLVLWRATGLYPMRANSSSSLSDSGWANSTNSKPSVPAGLSAEITAGGASCGNGPILAPPEQSERWDKNIIAPVQGACNRMPQEGNLCVDRA